VRCGLTQIVATSIRERGLPFLTVERQKHAGACSACSIYCRIETQGVTKVRKVSSPIYFVSSLPIPLPMNFLLLNLVSFLLPL
jgi:hypothetical protein